MSAVELEAFLAAMEVVRQANMAAMELAQHLNEAPADCHDQLGIAASSVSPTIH